MKMRATCAALAICLGLQAAANDYAAAQAKIDLINGGRLRAGTRLQFSASELTAYAVHEAPRGVYRPVVRLVAPGVAMGTAVVDFGEVRRGQGSPPGWLMAKLLDGQRPVSVTARIESGRGQATVRVEKVEISGVTIDGRTLDFLIQNFVVPMYPTAVVDKPFAMGERIERVDIQPAGVGVFIGK